MIFVSLLIAAAQASGLYHHACRIEDAVYVLRDQQDVTATYVRVESGWPSKLAMRLHVGSSGRTYWWLPWNGGSDGKQNLASTTDPTLSSWKPPSSDDGRERPLGDVEYIGTDAKYHLLNGVPERGELAPAHFLIPDLREALWYRTDSNERDDTAKQFFDLTGCKGPSHVVMRRITRPKTHTSTDN